MPRKYSLGKREASVARTRAAIINAFLRLLRRLPYRQITIKDIAREADVADKTVQRHFPSKGAIFVAWAQQQVEAVRRILLERANGHSPHSSIKRLVRSIYAAYEWGQEPIRAFVAAAESDAGELASYRQIGMAMRESLADFVIESWPGVWRFDAEHTRRVMAGLTSFLMW